MSQKLGPEPKPVDVKPSLSPGTDAFGLKRIVDRQKLIVHFDQKWQSKNEL